MVYLGKNSAQTGAYVLYDKSFLKSTPKCGFFQLLQDYNLSVNIIPEFVDYVKKEKTEENAFVLPKAGFRRPSQSLFGGFCLEC
jgi:hypothetical protein